MYVKCNFLKFNNLYTVSPPVISIQNFPSTFYVGGSALASIECYSIEPLSYQWYKDNKSMGVIYTKPFLSFNSLVLSNSGTYYCMVSNYRFKNIRSSSFTIKF